eukprot:gnl/TRDRNA2_/TRDRNA2_193818_c0_seq1.p1 gnl/TRDRNA2_/TRDRNA2_193818_c0~~gnl/TRDRNA2_/TRDRNA2_193818_c0_seq1.p1  ORF type:complete len:304 (+),score=12.64 gnl/TRDRNA2_/TRDRNA2_193818_c0_seq1:59-970(+)
MFFPPARAAALLHVLVYACATTGSICIRLPASNLTMLPIPVQDDQNRSTLNITAACKSVMENANRLFGLDNNGVIVRMGTVTDYDVSCPPWIDKDCGARTPMARDPGKMSWTLLNKFAWDSELDVLTVYTRTGKNRSEDFRPGIIAHPKAMHIVNCLYACDGYSCSRGRTSCGTMCSKKKSGFMQDDGRGKPCAFRPNEVPQMLQHYQQVKNGSGPWRHGVCDAWAPTHSAWNEITMMTSSWQNHIREFVWAFLVIDECFSNSKCLELARTWHRQFTRKWGQVPVLGMDRKNHVAPFHCHNQI